MHLTDPQTKALILTITQQQVKRTENELISKIRFESTPTSKPPPESSANASQGLKERGGN